MDEFFKTITRVTTVILSVLIAFFNGLTTFVGGGTTTTTATASTTVTTTKSISSVSTTKNGDTPTTDKGGTFTFVSYGWGHGVGMSQEGAIVMAKAGYGYVGILTHYYSGTGVYLDASTPKTITYNGTAYGIVEYLCKSTKQEIGDGSPKEAIKAQAAAIYSYAKNKSFKLVTGDVALDANFNYKGTNLYKYILEYLNMTKETDTPKAAYVSADKGKTAALTVFTASVAGRTANASDIWGGDYPYLVSVDSYEEPSVQVKTYTAAEMEDMIYNYNPNVNLNKDPSKWLTGIKNDGALTSDIGYVTSITVGDKTIKGNTFREKVMKNKINSPCFTVVYTPAA